MIAELRKLLVERGTTEFEAVSEWLGYLPFGQYIWIEVDGVEVKLASSWSGEDLDRLVADGSLILVERRVTSADGQDSRTRYRLRRSSETQADELRRKE